MTRRTKPLEAWVIVSGHGNGIDTFHREKPGPLDHEEMGDGMFVAHLTEHSPSAQRVVRAAIRLIEKYRQNDIKPGEFGTSWEAALHRAVEFHLKAERRRR